MWFIFSNLLQDIKRGHSQQHLAMVLHNDQSTISRKLNRKTNITVEEAISIVESFGFPKNTVCKYCKVKKNK